MRRIFTLLLLCGLLFSFQPASAQGGPGLNSVTAKIWPEYDKPDVLVIYYITVSAQTSLPATMTFRIPAAAQKPNALAIGNTLTTVSDQAVDYTLEPDGDWVKVIVQVTGPAIQLEYYDPALIKNGAQRQYTYVWPGDYAVDNFSVEVQQPYDASGMQTNPNLPKVNPIADELTYYTGDFGALPAGKTFTLTAKYQKDSDALSVSFMNVQPSAPVDESTTGRVSIGTYLPWLIAAVGVLMIAGGLYYYFRGTGRPRPTARRRHASSEEKTADGQTYCPQCGARARGGDRFCRTCGTRLRTETEE
jgi:hypothetical protein